MLPPKQPPSAVMSVLAAVIVLAGVSYGSYHAGYLNGRAAYSAQTAATAASPAHLAIGAVASVSGKGILLRGARIVPDSTNSGVGTTTDVTVVVDSHTTIERLVPKSLATMEKERAAYTAAKGTNLAPPDPFTREKLSLAAIKAGDLLAVRAATDITGQVQFTAVSIEVAVSVAPTAKKSP